MFLLGWSLLWTLCLPAILFYLRRRARKDALYGRHLAERFGRHARAPAGAVWIHAVSLGELRSAVPLIRGLLARGERIVVTAFTPAGRRAAATAFGPEIAAGRLTVVWVPFELAWCYRSFFRAFRPKLGLVMEIEIWPRMVQAARDAGVPLYMCNAQYPLDSMLRDRRLPLRPAVMRRFAGAFVKSRLQADRFAGVGVANVTVTGELRFDQPIPPEQIAAAPLARRALAGDRRVLAFASMTEPEEDLFLATLSRLPGDVFTVLIPRAPERFEPVAAALAGRGLRFVRRSAALTTDLRPAGPATADILLGDSLGEMQFYLALADRVVVGGGFQPKGSHNIIEPLALGRPVIVGPHIQTIEYPAVEAIAAGVCLQTTPGALGAALDWPGPPPGAIAAFLAEHSGATARTLAALAPLLRPS
ncbi:MAG: 3-deoxy-D-manno-octulosonic acid transferase [Rhodobacteraceae bacterium]|nr:3-deoxy-D-manno-octulosonic acid transferase [Paracoccaceae bacterium]